MKISAKTDIGKMRSVNQDAYACGEFSQEAVWAVVCDGMGGASAGDVASNIATTSIAEKLSKSFNPQMNFNSVVNLMRSIIETANLQLYSMAVESTALQGMGTTVVAAVVSGNNIYIASAGDSRAYYYCKDNGFTQITRDHSVVQEMVECGEITPDEARVHPRKNIITRALGVDSEIELDFYDYEISDDGILLICSDGLTNYVDDATISEVLSSTDFDSIAVKLVNLANDNGGGDNITVVAITR